ncbi:MAG TPA: SRPBCC family protein [Gammaproteobacteria bacterium]|nr:SRPBCC family protein [Gammaproteobacteria bacterium]
MKIIGIAVIVVVVAVLVYASTQPDTFEIHRSTSIKAPPEKIFPFLNDFRQAMLWSPYEKKDPAMKRSFSGPAGGKGSVYEFEGNKDIGAGRLEILDSVADSRVTLRLDMHKPFKGSNIIEYALEPKGETTDMIWSMHGEAPFISRVICLFMNMDNMVGKDFEAGLASLKSLVESGAP